MRVLIPLLTAGVIALAVRWHTGDDATLLLTIYVVALTAATLWVVAPVPARVAVSRMDELGLTDLIFYIVPTPAEPGERRIPRDFLLQLHIALSNTGGRKCVVSVVRLRRLLDRNGVGVDLPDLPLPLGAAQAVMQSGWSGGHPTMSVMNTFPPYTLDPGDEIQLRVRARRGVDWSDGWTLDRLREAATALSREVVAAEVDVMSRRGGREPKSRTFKVPVATTQQIEYARLLATLTNDFTALPDIATMPFDYE